MRLDHLLSRDLGVCGGRGARTGASRVLSWPVGGPDEQHGSTLPSHPAFCWVGGGCPPSFCCFLRVCVGCGGGGVGACCRGLGLRALCVLLLLPSSCCAAACCGGGVGGLWGCGWVGCELYSGREYLCSLWCVFVVCLAPGSCCAVRGVVGSGAWFLPVLCVVFMGVRWMPWHQGPMKDVVDCDKPRGAVLRALIRGFPNGGTRRPSRGVTRV